MPKAGNVLKEGEFIEKLEKIRELAGRCISEITNRSARTRSPEKIEPKTIRISSLPEVNFNLNARAFLKIYSKQLSGPKKFVLILAYLARGKVNKGVSLPEIEKLWKRTAGLIGIGFNTAYAVRAKDEGWVNSIKQGLYILTDSWKEIFSHD